MPRCLGSLPERVRSGGKRVAEKDRVLVDYSGGVMGRPRMEKQGRIAMRAPLHDSGGGIDTGLTRLDEATSTPCKVRRIESEPQGTIEQAPSKLEEKGYSPE